MRGDGRVFTRGKIFWISYYAPDPDQPGQRKEFREPGGRKPEEARRLLKQRRQEVAVHDTGLRPFQGPKQERVTVEEILDAVERDYEIHGRRSLPQLKSHLRHVRAFLGMDRALAVTPGRLPDYNPARQRAVAASATINRELEALARAFGLAVEAGTLTMAPKFPSLPERNARQGFFERDEFEAVGAYLADHDVRDFLSWF